MAHAVHVLSGEDNDWIVREEDGRELGHYPTKFEAEAVGYKVARKRKVELLIHGPSGEVERRSRPSRGWLSKLFGR